ncbi:MAG: peptidoglycan-binding domain-containing protein [Ferruginibacter sp.]
MNLSLGSGGEKVREVQESLNKLPTRLPLLVPDSKFGSKTEARVIEFQRNHNLDPERTHNLNVDGVVGPKTLDAINLKVQRLGVLPPKPVPVTESVRSINEQLFGFNGPDNLLGQPIPSFQVINESTFQPGDNRNVYDYRAIPAINSRMGIFAARKNNLERAIIFILPPTGKPNKVLIGISHGFAANELAFYESKGWGNPLSKPLIESVLQNHVITGHSWAGQMLASKKQMAYMHIVRARGIELGPFARDGQFVFQTLTELASLTKNAFSFDDGVEVFTYSSGINDMNIFLSAVREQLVVKGTYSIDPAPAINPFRIPQASLKQFLSGQTSRGESRPGFEFLGPNRWRKERRFGDFSRGVVTPLVYFHGQLMPGYVLNLALQLS